MAALLAACGGDTADNNENTGDDAATEAGGGDITQNPDYQKGLDLIGASDCLTCHKVNEKLVGPAYDAVANRYAGSDTAVNYLAMRIINGVNPSTDKANWADETGGAVMTPHPQISQGDAEQMAKYILLLKTQ